MIGTGNSWRAWTVGRADEEKEVGELLELAVKILADSMVPALLPKEGFQIVYALRGARRREDVAGITGGLVRKGGKVRPAGGVAFGAGGGVAGMVLTAMHTDPEIRSAAAIRFSPAISGILGDLLLEVCEFDRAREPPGVSTIDWGVAFCCRDGIPDVVLDRGAPGKEGLVRVLGEDPVKVARTIERIGLRLEQ